MKKPTGNGSKTEFRGKIPTENLTKRGQNTKYKYKYKYTKNTQIQNANTNTH